MILTIEINTTKDDPMLVDKALGRIYTIDGVEDVRLLDTGIEELEQENRLLRARNERLEGEAKQQPAEEPVAWDYRYGDTWRINEPQWNGSKPDEAVPLYTRPQPAAQVSPLEFVTMVLEKEHLVGKPLIWAEWPNKEKSNG